jgi:hypothetical protein
MIYNISMVEGPHEDECETAAARHFMNTINTLVGLNVIELKKIAQSSKKPYRANVATVLLKAAGNLGMNEIVVPKRIKEEKK